MIEIIFVVGLKGHVLFLAAAFNFFANLIVIFGFGAVLQMQRESVSRKSL